jgi:hypothetical protein
VADSILDLQARAGNQAVAELLAAPGVDAVGPVALQRDATDAAPADDRDQAGPARMAIPELELDLPLQSFQQTPGRGPGRGQSGDEFVVTMAAGKGDVRLQEAAAKGRSFAVVTITFGSMTFTLHGVVISSFQVGGDISTFTLNFTSVEVTRRPAEDRPGKERREPGE